VPIPLFPLHVVLFPGAALPLHVFEQRYRTMMSTVLAEAEPSFGVACIREGYEVGERAETHDIGTLATVEQVARHEDGTMDLLVRGARRFRIDERPADDPYPRAEVTFLDDVAGPRPERALALARSALDRYLAVVARVSGRERPDLTLPEDPIEASYAASTLLAVDLPLKQRLLEAATASTRLADAAALARSEASLLETVGPPVPRTGLDRTSLN
jgi:uncharacterized protein